MKLVGVILAAALVLAACTAAPAQQVPLQAGPWVAGHLPMYSGSGGTQPIIQDAGTAGGGAAGANPGEIGISARGTGTPPYADQGHGPNGEIFCTYDGPTTAAAGYHYLCMSPNADGGGLISYGAAGGSANLPFDIIVNGVSVLSVVTNSFADNLTATGSNQGTAFLVTAETNAFTTVAVGTGSILPTTTPGGLAISAGYHVQIINAGANPVAVYPPTGQSTNGGSVNAAVTIYPNAAAVFTYRGVVSGTAQWYAR